MTRIKLVLVRLTIAAGVIIIIAWQWRNFIHKNDYGSGSFNQGLIGQTLLGIVMAGIPAVLFAVLAYLALEWLLFDRGELENYRARRRIAGMRRATGNTPHQPAAPAKPEHDYVD